MNIRQIKAIEAGNKKRILAVCPCCTERPGIYIFYRTDTETGLRFCYVGQAKHLLSRCAQHLSEYDHIALSLKKRGFYDPMFPDKNPGGWKLEIWECSGYETLDGAETEAIKEWADRGYQLFNRTGGSQSAGKVAFDNKKPSRGYFDGLEQGQKNARRFISDLFSKHLTVSTKRTPPTVNQQKALQKFMDFINLEETK